MLIVHLQLHATQLLQPVKDLEEEEDIDVYSDLNTIDTILAFDFLDIFNCTSNKRI